ncbi:MAG: T9SS type A sorting domain-containing protein [Bacteroidetes bacterium]|nr:T9SS type A sorting domain-containing protein [Bacteroidota bacterium]
MFNHLKEVYAIKVNSTDGINTLRNYLFDHLEGSPTGGIACFTTSSYTLNNMPQLPPGTPEEGKHIVAGFESDPNHGLTVVGYNDSIRYDVNEDGLYTNDIDITGDGVVDARDWEIGGFLIANSYGRWWSDDGYTYALYRSFALNYNEGGVWNNRVYVVKPDTAYQPLLTIRASLNYNARNKLRIRAGVSRDTMNILPEHVIDFPVFNFQGGNHAMLGNDTIPEAKSIEFGLDVTELLNFIPAGQPARFFLIVEEKDPDYIGQGTIGKASLFGYYHNTLETPINGEDVDIKDNNTTMVSAVAFSEKPDVKITTTSLPPYTPLQPTHFQLEASGGKPPYDWSFAEEYIKKPVVTPEPMISGTSVYVNDEIKSFASVALPFSFPFYGKKFDSIYVNYYGFICFEPQNLPTYYTTDEMGMLRMFPLIAPSFSQQYAYLASKNDGIWIQSDASRAIIRWKVSAYGTSGSVYDFAVILYPDGRFEFCYGTMDNQGFNHIFYKGVSKGDGLNFDIQTQWNANDIAGKSYLFYPPVTPDGLNLSQEGLLTVSHADSTMIYGLNFRATDAGKISASKTLMLSSGLKISEALNCGADARLKAGQPASLRLIIANNGLQAIQNLVLKIQPYNTQLQLTDSSFTVPVLNPGQSLTIPTAFSFRLRDPLPDQYPVMLKLAAQSSSQTWKKELLFPVAAPELVVESPVILDGYDGRMDPGEIADLSVNIKNTGSLAAQNLQIKLLSIGPVISCLSDSQIGVDQIDMLGAKDYRFQIKASRETLPGSEAPMQLLLSDSTGVIRTVNFNLLIGTKLVAIVNLSASPASSVAMGKALYGLHVGYDTIHNLTFKYNRYKSIFLILGSAVSGSYPLKESEGTLLAEYLKQGGNLYMEGYFTWYHTSTVSLHPFFKYTSKKIPAFYYPSVKGIPGTFTDSMAYEYSAPLNYSIYDFMPVFPAYPTLVNTDSLRKNLQIVYHGDDYRTIASRLDFSALTGGSAPSTQAVMMQRYLDFFDLSSVGPFPLFHAGIPAVCKTHTVTFTDDSFDNITSRSWEFQGGTPATSTEANPVVRYDTAGKFDVKLTVSDGINTRTILKSRYIQVDQCSGLQQDQADPPLFTIFPNPATDEVTIKINRNISGNCKLMLFDLSGCKVKEILQIIPAGNQLTMSLSGLGKGLYFLKAVAGEKNCTVKVIKN